MADELKDLSLEIEAAMDNCIRNSDIKLHLRDFKYLVARVRDSKRKVFGALKSLSNNTIGVVNNTKLPTMAILQIVVCLNSEQRLRPHVEQISVDTL
nr:hypothetical protein CFP56_34018 [Quercus suber]